MGIEDVNVRPDEPDDQAKGQPEPDRSPPANQSEPSEQASGVGKRATLEADDGAASDAGEATTESMTGLADQKSPERPRSALAERSSFGRFDTLADEFDARAQSHENAKASNKSLKLSNLGLNAEAIQDRIDPNAPDLGKSEGHKESFRRAIKENDSEWTDGVDSFGDLPSGQDLCEAEGDERSVFGNLRAKIYENAGSLDDQANKVSEAIEKALGGRPTGHAEVRTNNGPVVHELHPSGIDTGSTASALLALGLVGAEATRRVVNIIGEWRG